jgi:hypothetical protein
MSGDTEIDDPDVSDGGSENDYSEHEQEPDVVGKEEDDNADMAEQKFRPDSDENGKAGSTATKPKLDPKDPLRPRRKKARRACFACQRAHLTCGMSVFLRTKNCLVLVCISFPANLFRPMS